MEIFVVWMTTDFRAISWGIKMLENRYYLQYFIAEKHAEWNEMLTLKLLYSATTSNLSQSAWMLREENTFSMKGLVVWRQYNLTIICVGLLANCRPIIILICNLAHAKLFLIIVLTNRFCRCWRVWRHENEIRLLLKRRWFRQCLTD